MQPQTNDPQSLTVLAVDTATPVCSVALVRGTDVLAECNLHTGKTHAAHLMNLISQVLAHGDVKLEQVDGFAVGQGPGSFTGLRIGISTVKGLAAGSGKPVVGISTLEVLAWQARCPGYVICPMIDARRGEVYTARYAEGEDGFALCDPESVMPPEKALTDATSPCIIVGSGAELYRDIFYRTAGISVHAAPPGQHQVRASTLALRSLDRFRESTADSAARVSPRYIRESDAERNRDRGGIA